MALLELLIEALRVALFWWGDSSAYSMEKLETVRPIYSIWCHFLHVAGVYTALVESVLVWRGKRVQGEDLNDLIEEGPYKG